MAGPMEELRAPSTLHRCLRVGSTIDGKQITGEPKADSTEKGNQKSVEMATRMGKQWYIRHFITYASSFEALWRKTGIQRHFKL